MIRWFVRLMVRVALNDPVTRREIIRAANPEWWWDLEYGDRKNPPPKPTWKLFEPDPRRSYL